MAWNNFRGYGAPDRLLIEKLKYLKTALKSWRVMVSQVENGVLVGLRNKVEALDIAVESHTLLDTKKIKWREAKLKI